MILRNLARTKLRAAVTVGGVAMAASILLLSFFMMDATEELVDRQFRLTERQDVTVTFHDVTPSTFQIGQLEVTADLITHPGSTLGYRISEIPAVLEWKDYKHKGREVKRKSSTDVNKLVISHSLYSLFANPIRPTGLLAIAVLPSLRMRSFQICRSTAHRFDCSPKMIPLLKRLLSALRS